MSKFLELLSKDVRSYCKVLQGASYIPWALALEMASYPQQTSVMFKHNGADSLVRPLFGGAAVAIDQALPSGKVQRTYLPVLNAKNYPVTLGEVDGRDITDTLNRCRARSVAMIDGVGLSLWSECEGDGVAYSNALGLTPDSDLRKVAEIRDTKRMAKSNRTQSYLGWHAALSAARITDADFHWEVMECQTVDENGELVTMPALRANGVGWIVGVKVTWKGIEHVEWLPIMGVAVVQTGNGPKPMEHQSIEEVSVFHWHSAVMRCLTKAIALTTGYGIRCYAGDIGLAEDFDAAEDGDCETRQQPQGQQRQQPQGQQRQQPQGQQRQQPQGQQRQQPQGQQRQQPQGEQRQQPQGQQRQQPQGQQRQQPQGQQRQQPQGQQRQQPQGAAGSRGAFELSQEEMVEQVRKHLKLVGGDEANFISWLGVDSLETSSREKLNAGLGALNRRIKDKSATTAN